MTLNNNLFLQVNNLINNKKDIRLSPTRNISSLGITPIMNNNVNYDQFKPTFERIGTRIAYLENIMKKFKPEIVNGCNVYAYNDRTIAITEGSILFNGELINITPDANLIVDGEQVHRLININTDTSGIYYIVPVGNTTSVSFSLVELPNDNDLIIAKLIINSESDAIDNDANNDYSNNYIVSGKDLLLNPNYVLDDESRAQISNILTEILAENIIGQIRLNENLTISNQQDSVKLDSTSMQIYNDTVKYAEFNKDGVYFYNEDEEVLAQYTKDGILIGNILITPNTLQSTNYQSGQKGFKIQSDGDVEFNNITARGTIYANAGLIGGWGVYNNRLIAPNDDVGLAPGDYPFYAGDTYANRANAPYRVTPDGTIFAKNGIFAGTLRSNVFEKNEVSVLGGDLMISPCTQLDGNITGSATSITIDPASGGINVNDLLQIEDEVIKVDNISGTTVTITRGFGSTSGVAHNDGVTTYKIGEVSTNNKGFIKLNGQDNKIQIYDVDASATGYTQTEVVTLGNLGSGTYGLKIKEGELQLDKTSYSDTTSGIWMGRDSGTYKINIGDASNNIKWDGSSLSILGSISATTGNIGGFTIGSDNISGGNLVLYASGTILHSNFKVDSSGNLSAVNATLAGTITASAGSIGGFNIQSDNISGGNLVLYASGAITTTNFSVNSSGNLSATGGTIGGWTIGSTYLSGGSTRLNSNGNISATALNINSDFGTILSGIVSPTIDLAYGVNIQTNISGTSFTSGTWYAGSFNDVGDGENLTSLSGTFIVASYNEVDVNYTKSGSEFDAGKVGLYSRVKGDAYYNYGAVNVVDGNGRWNIGTFNNIDNADADGTFVTRSIGYYCDVDNNSSGAGGAWAYGYYGIVNGIQDEVTGAKLIATGEGAADVFGVYGQAIATGNGTDSYGIYGTASSTSGTAYAGYFDGNVKINGIINTPTSIGNIDDILYSTFFYKRSISSAACAITLDFDSTSDVMYLIKITSYIYGLTGSTEALYEETTYNGLITESSLSNNHSTLMGTYDPSGRLSTSIAHVGSNYRVTLSTVYSGTTSFQKRMKVEVISSIIPTIV